MPISASRAFAVTTASGTALVTSTSWIPLNQHQTPFNVSFGVVKTGNGEITFRVQHTFDDVLDPNVTPTAFTHADVSAATASVDGNYAYPIKAIRLSTVSASSSSALSLTVLQAGY